MIEVLKEFPDNVTAYVCHERLTKADYETVLRDIEDKLTRHEKLRMYCVVSPDYLGVEPDARAGTITDSSGGPIMSFPH